MDRRRSHSCRSRPAAFDLTWLEEPIIPDDISGQARIMATGVIPIAAGENLYVSLNLPKLAAYQERRTDAPNQRNVAATLPHSARS